MSGIWRPPPVMIATPIGRREISSAIAVVRPSTLAMIAFRSFGFVTFRMICVLHWLRTFLSTFAARCVMTTSPRPNFRPSEASVRNTFDDAAWPTCGQKLWDSSTTSIIGGIRPTFRSSNIAVARRLTTSSWMSGGTPFRLMIVVLLLITSSSMRVPSFAKISTSLRYSSSSISDAFCGSSSRSRTRMMSRIENHARHVVLHQFLDQDAGDVRLAAAGLRQDRHVLLDHRVDVQIDRHIMAGEEADVGAVFLVLFEPNHLLNRGCLGLIDRLARTKRGARDLQETAIVTIADYADLGRDPLLDVNGITVPKQLGAVERQIGLPLDFVDAAEDLAASLMGHLDELVAFDRLDDGATERRRAYIAVDHAYKSVAMV